MNNISDEVLEIEGLYKIVHLQKFRETEGVLFEVFPKEFLENVSGVDKVIHRGNAVSPGKIGDVERPWYMHPFQWDNLIVLKGKRYIDLYSVKHGKKESFIVTPDEIYHNGTLICNSAGILTWPPYVFHRVESKEEGSASLNFAYRYDGFDFKDNFNIYMLNDETGEYKVIREGHEDQI